MDSQPESYIILSYDVTKSLTYGDIDEYSDSSFEQPQEIADVLSKFDYFGSFITSQTFYTTLPMIVALRRKSDGQIFGYPYERTVHEYGEHSVVANTGNYGWSSDTPENFCLWLPVGEVSLPSYSF